MTAGPPPPAPADPVAPAGAPADATAGALAAHERRVDALLASLAADAAPPPLRIDTPISTVIVAADRAWKLKRPVRLPFVDLTDAAERRRLCVAEVRLNRRLAPALYLGVAPVDERADGARFGEPRPLVDEADAPTGVAEYAVAMRAFEQAALWANRVPAGGVDAEQARTLGRTIGVFHRDRATPRPGSPHGSATAFAARVRDNFATLRALGAADASRLDALEHDAASRHARLAALRDARDRDGFVRDGHGDLHLANIVTIDGAAVPFDCLEFDEGLRISDVADELAFPTMDLRHAGREDLALALVDGWLEATGDFAALALLDDGRAYRATVRAKVAALDAARAPGGTHLGRCAAYLHTADSFSRRPAPVLVTAHGLSGSGKSVVSAALAAAIGAVRLRSDVERKRIRGLAPDARDGAGGPMYAPGARAAVYDRLAAIARTLLADGWPVVVDAAFLERAQRARFAALAADAGVAHVLLHVDAPEPVLRERLAARAARGNDPSDADLAVLDAQLRTHEPLDGAERAAALAWRVQDPPTVEAARAAWHAHREARAR